MKKEGNKKLFIVLLLVLLLALAVGYAAFSDTLTISGTANVNGSFDVKFVAANVLEQEGCTANILIDDQTGGSETNIDDDLLTVSVVDLAYPGAGASFHATIQNVGSIPVKITGVTPTNITGNGNAIKITGLNIFDNNHATLSANDTCDFTFTVEWDEAVTVLNNTIDGENGSDFSFGLVITYEQDTTSVNRVNSHTDNTSGS